MSAPIINDTTLCDGEQTVGVAFTLDQRCAIAAALSRAGVAEIEVGIPALGEDEIACIKAIVDLNLDARLMVWGNLTQRDLAAALRCNADIVHLSIPVSDIRLQDKLQKPRRWVLEQIVRVIAEAVKSDRKISLGMEDASRADPAFLVQVARCAQQHGAQRVRFADTLGVLDPFSTYEAIARLRDAVDLEIEIHAHDDLGLATANTLAALRAGATHANTTVDCLGKRAGNAALEEIVIGARHLLGRDTGINTEALPAVCRLIEWASGRIIFSDKSIVDRGVLTSDPSDRTGGITKHRRTHEEFEYPQPGRQRSVALGEHCGPQSVHQAYSALGVSVAEWLVPLLLDRIRHFAAQYKQAPSASDLYRFLAEAGETLDLRLAEALRALKLDLSRTDS
ncbi:homocitrate synthase [Trinickia symbiotica]|uniref:Homocitrate synthase n=1 Tax=Trinickia symbiotica TaxID=863227 RepID=A0A2T3XL75_9BURK|nr:homocitrate synthase [Trinickia symbiotica]PTB17273.1 homocitrate synthase [Trinickia symbiotica]